MHGRFTFNLFLLVLSNLLVKPLWIFGVDRMVQNQVGPAAWGTYFAVFNFSLLFGVLLDPGIHNFTNRAISRHPERLGGYLINLSLLKMGLSVAYFLITLGLAAAAGFGEAQQHWLVILLLNQIILQGILFFRAQIGALQHFRTDALFSVSDKLLSLVFCSLLLLSQKNLSLDTFLYAQTAALTITAMLAGIYVFRQPLVHTSIWSAQKFKRILWHTRGFAWLAFFMAIYFRADGILLERLLSGDHKQEAGIYAASYRILDAANMVAFLLSTLLLPLFSSAIREGKNVSALIQYTTNLLWVAGMALCVLAICRADMIIALLYPGGTTYWGSVFRILMVAFLPISSVYVFGTLLTARGDLRPLIRIAITGTLITLILQCIAIPLGKAKGAAVATVISQIIIAILHFSAAQKHFSVQVFYKNGKSYLLHLIGMACFGLIVHLYNLGIWTALILIPIASLLLGAMTGLIEKEWVRSFPLARNLKK